MKPLGAYPDASWPEASDFKCIAYGSSAGAVSVGSLSTLNSTAVDSAPQYVKIMSNVTAFFCPNSTAAAVPVTSATSGQAAIELVQANWMYQSRIPVGSTGWSLAFLTSGYASLSFYKR